MICEECTNNIKNKIKTKEEILEDAIQFNTNDYEYKMCIQCGSIVDYNIFSINDLCIHCDKLMKINVDNSVIADLFEKQYTTYIAGAKCRNLKFNLTKIDCFKFFSKNCF